MAGSSVTIRIKKPVDGIHRTVQSIPYPIPQSHGHIMLSFFKWTHPGSFRASAMLTAGTKAVATRDVTEQ
jgi:hypothetical protein